MLSVNQLQLRDFVQNVISIGGFTSGFILSHVLFRAHSFGPCHWHGPKECARNSTCERISHLPVLKNFTLTSFHTYTKFHTYQFGGMMPPNW